ncbi:hypothetical protein ABMA28_006800 [Loxostege sticticalis]|uniref:Peptidase S1 domain-containing protein n=1 Tax=Loxostege sticticalis TaxID=481309 RepID=A0ABD0TNI5_LOXSC
MRSLIVLAFTMAVASAAIPPLGRIIGGSLTTINQYPEMVQVLQNHGTNFMHVCGSSILNNRAILSAAHCTALGHSDMPTNSVRIRYGSSFRSSGGTVLTINRIINHPNYNPSTMDNDISILWVNGNIPVTATSRPARIAGSRYYPADNQVVWAAGWGFTIYDDMNSMSEQLRHVQIWTVNQDICRQRYLSTPMRITDNMLCSGVLDVGGRDQCTMDSGGPLFHNGVVVGVCSFGMGCGLPYFPGVNARVSRYTNWINQNR